MSRTLGEVRVCFTINKPEHLPEKNGEQMYADDVIEEVREVLDQILDAWYAGRGRDLLDCPPDTV